jgi:hypothetical protein
MRNELATAEYDAAMNAWYEYEFREWDVECTVCGSSDHDTQMLLEKKGWKLTQYGEFCPKCERGH